MSRAVFDGFLAEPQPLGGGRRASLARHQVSTNPVEFADFRVGAGNAGEIPVDPARLGINFGYVDLAVLARDVADFAVITVDEFLRAPSIRLTAKISFALARGVELFTDTFPDPIFVPGRFPAMPRIRSVQVFHFLAGVLDLAIACHRSSSASLIPPWLF